MERLRLMRQLDLIVPEEAAGQRLDAWTAAACGELSRSAVQAEKAYSSIFVSPSGSVTVFRESQP